MAFSIFVSIAFAEEDNRRIRVVDHDLSEVSKIYVSFGRASYVEMPCEIDSFIKSPTNDYQVAFVKEDLPESFTLWLRDSNSQPSSLLVLCSNKEVFAFDVVPRKNIEHLYTKVRRGKNKPQILSIEPKELIMSSEMESKSKVQRKEKPSEDWIEYKNKKGLRGWIRKESLLQ